MRSLRLRLLLTVAAVSVVTLAGVGVFSARTTTLDLQKIVGPASKVDAASLVPTLEAAYRLRGSWSNVEAVLVDLEARTGERYVLLSPHSEMVASSDPSLASMRSSIDRAGRLDLTATSAGGAASALVLDVPKTALRNPRGSIVGFLYVLPKPDLGLPLQESQAEDINRRLWIAIFIAAIAATVAAFVLSAQILRPIEALIRASRRLAARDLGVRIATPGVDEIGTLGRSFNAMADELEHLDQLRKDMVADIAHELRTPLTHMRARIEAIQDGRLPADSSTLSALHADALQLVRLVSDLQDVGLADAGRLRLSREPVDIGPVVRTAVETLGRDGVDARIPNKLPSVLADPARVRQVIDNLLVNAKAHVHPGGTIRVTCEISDRCVRVVVHNDGARLAEAELTRIFERFYRTDKSRSRLTGGAGLGLTIVKQLVEALGGWVHAENTDDPEGVSVTFALPIADLRSSL